MDCNGNDSWDFRRRLGNEAAIIDELYYFCDTENVGKVPVSKLVDFLRLKVDAENQPSIQSLQTFLDPTDTDDEINLETYRRRINLWIDSVRTERQDSGSSSDVEDTDSPFPSPSDSSLAAGDSPKDALPGFIRAFPEYVGATCNHDCDHEKLLNLQHLNKKLSESNEKHRQQLEAQEETLTTTSLENDRLKKKVKDLQDTQDVQRESEVLIAELKTQLTKYVEKRKELENKVNCLERDNAILQKHVTDNGLKIQELNAELRSSQKQVRELANSLVEQKKQCMQLSETKAKLDKQIAEKENKYVELEDCTRRLSKMNEELRVEQVDLKLRLAEAQQEIICHQSREEKANTSNSSGFGEDQDEGNALHVLPTPNCDKKVPSIQNELSDLLGEVPGLPSPFCEKIAGNMFSFDRGHGDMSGCSAPERKYRAEAHDLVSKCRESRDHFFKLVEDMFSPSSADLRGSSGSDSGCPSSTSDQGGSPRQMDIPPDLKFRRFLWVMKRLRDENERLRRSGRCAPEEQSDSEHDVDTTVVDNRILVLQDSLTDERRQRRHLEEELEDLRRKLEEMTAEYQRQKKYCQSLEEDLENVKRSNVDLAEKCHKSELRASELQEEVLQASTYLSQERRHSGDLEENLSESRVHHLSDLKELWRLVQKDVETECMEEQRDSPDSGSTEVLREKIASEIEGLRERLQKRQIALRALKLSLSGPPSDNAPDHFCRNQFGDSPSSPLLDALAIDFFNGNNVLCVGKKRSCALASLNQGECTICNKRNSGHYTPSQVLSCPSLHPRYSHRAQAAMPGQSDPGLNTMVSCNPQMSSSSSSGVDVSPRYLRSNSSAQARRRDFSRSSQRYSSGSQTSNSADSSNTVNPRRPPRPPCKDHLKVMMGESPHQRRPSYTSAIENSTKYPALRRDRSFSFQNAIERSQGSPAEETDFIETSADTTPEALDFVPTSYAVEPGMTVVSRGEGKTVSFCLRPPDLPPQLHCPGERDDPPTPTGSPRTAGGRDGTEAEWTDAVDSPCRDGDLGQHSQQASSVTEPEQLEKPEKSQVTEQEMQAVQDSSFARCQRSVPDGSSPKMSAARVSVKGEDTRPLGHAEGMTNVQEHDASPPVSTPASRTQGAQRLVVAPGGSREGGSRSPTPTRASSPSRTASTSRLAQLRLSNLAKKRGQAWSSKMAELPEQEPEPEPRPAPGSPEALPLLGVTAPPEEAILQPPTPSLGDEVTPSLPDDFLVRLGLDPGLKDSFSADQMAETELEGKFSSLALAFKTDKLTLKQRLEIQERSRIIAEQNVDSEIKCLRTCIEELKQMCADAQMRAQISKLESHIDVLEQAAARVSSRSEVLGAVVQENRMSNAMDVMVVYVENLKRMHEREHAELEEAKKHLHDRSSSLLPDIDHCKRSMSVCAVNATTRTRRRSEVALPRMIGGVGSPSLLNTQSLLGCSRESSTEDEDPRQRFQSAVASTTVRNVITSSLRKASLERQNSVSSSTSSFSRDNSGERGKDEKKELNSKQGSQEEEAYQKGFEAGLKTKLGEELLQLREQQNDMSAKIESTMDRVDESREEEEKREAQMAAAREAILVRIGQFKPNWATASRNIRLILCGILCLLAFIVTMVTVVLPVTVNVSKNNGPSH